MTTKIEWTDETWNPWVGCDKIAPECGNCYAAVNASRGLWPWHKGTAAKGEWTGNIHRAAPTIWAAPHKWPTGIRVFTCSMSDFWHERVPLDWLDEALGVIEATPHLTYQILTKRPGNIARKVADLKRRLPDNVWIGVTIGHPQLLPALKPLLRVDAAVRFLSVEPLLAPLVPGLDLSGIGWLICGGESGNGARQCNPDWVRAVRDLCVVADVPFFLKQWGTWPGNNPTPPGDELDPDAKGGATLDGRLWRQFPQTDHTMPGSDPEGADGPHISSRYTGPREDIINSPSFQARYDIARMALSSRNPLKGKVAADELRRQLLDGPRDSDKSATAQAAERFIRDSGEQIEWLATARFEMYEALGEYLDRTPRLGRGRPAKMSAGGIKLQSLADLGVTDRHIASDAIKVLRVSEPIRQAYKSACAKNEDTPTVKGLFRFVKARYLEGASGADPLPATDDETAMVARAREPRGTSVKRPNAVKNTVATLFHPTTDAGTRNNAAVMLMKLVPDAEAKISRALLSNGATLPPLPTAGGEDTVLADGTVFRSTPTWQQIVAEKDATIIAYRDEVARLTARIARLKRENAQLRRRAPHKKGVSRRQPQQRYSLSSEAHGPTPAPPV